MDYVLIDGAQYACPFANLFAPLNEDESSYLRQSISELGIRNPVITYDSPVYGPALIQGRNRLRISEQLGVTVPRNHLGSITDADARKIACDVQAAGRTLSPGQVEQARRERAKRVQEMAASGMSTRTIADTLRTSQSTVQRTLQSAPAHSDDDSDEHDESPQPQPRIITGRDGKTYRQAPPAPPKPPDESELLQFATDCVKRAKELLKRLASEIDVLLTGPLASAVRSAATNVSAPIPGDAQTWSPITAIRHVLNDAASAAERQK